MRVRPSPGAHPALIRAEQADGVARRPSDHEDDHEDDHEHEEHP